MVYFCPLKRRCCSPITQACHFVTAEPLCSFVSLFTAVWKLCFRTCVYKAAVGYSQPPWSMPCLLAGCVSQNILSRTQFQMERGLLVVTAASVECCGHRWVNSRGSRGSHLTCTRLLLSQLSYRVRLSWCVTERLSHREYSPCKGAVKNHSGVFCSMSQSGQNVTVFSGNLKNKRDKIKFYLVIYFHLSQHVH